MINQKVTYETDTYDALKGFLIGLPIFSSVAVIVIVVGRYLQSESFAVIGLISVCTIPFLFQKRVKRLTTRKLVLDFGDESLVTKERYNN